MVLNHTVNLLASSAYYGAERMPEIRMEGIGTGQVTIQCNGAETINGSNSIQVPSVNDVIKLRPKATGGFYKV